MSERSVTRFQCGFRVSACHGATVVRICTAGKPDVFECSYCKLGLPAAKEEKR